MKKIILFGFVILIMLAVFVNAAQTTERPPNAYEIEITLVSQIPDPAEPGKYVDVRFKFENHGSEIAQNMEAEILPEYPFALDPGEEATKSLGSIDTQQTGDAGVIIKYRLRINEDALEGQSPIKLRYRVNNQAWVTLPEFDINIQPYDAILVLEKVVSNPQVIRPGKEATVDLTFKNAAEILLKKVRVIMDLGGAPVAPLGSTNEKVIEKIDANEEETVRFNLIGEPDAQAGIYKVGVAYVYYDALGNAYSRNSTIGMIFGSEPDLLVDIDSATIYQSGVSGTATVKIVNRGANEIKFLTVKLGESDSYNIISPSEVYVGNIDSDDYETTDFNIFVKNTKQEMITLPVHLEFKDGNDKKYVEDINLELELYGASKAKEYGLVQGNGKVGFVVVIIVVVVGLFVYRRWRKSRKK